MHPAGPADLEAIAATEHASGRGPLSPSAAVEAVADPDRHVVVATVDAAVIGWGKTHYWDYDDGPFTEMARGPQFHTTTFTGGLGLLMCAAAPGAPSPQTMRGGRIRS